MTLPANDGEADEDDDGNDDADSNNNSNSNNDQEDAQQLQLSRKVVEADGERLGGVAARGQQVPQLVCRADAAHVDPADRHDGVTGPQLARDGVARPAVCLACRWRGWRSV